MKLKNSKKDQKLVRVLKKILDKNRKMEDALFAELSSRMALTDLEQEILWDYVYNNSRWMVKLENE